MRRQFSGGNPTIVQDDMMDGEDDGWLRRNDSFDSAQEDAYEPETPAEQDPVVPLASPITSQFLMSSVAPLQLGGYHNTHSSHHPKGRTAAKPHRAGKYMVSPLEHPVMGISPFRHNSRMQQHPQPQVHTAPVDSPSNSPLWPSFSPINAGIGATPQAAVKSREHMPVPYSAASSTDVDQSHVSSSSSYFDRSLGASSSASSDSNPNSSSTQLVDDDLMTPPAAVGHGRRFFPTPSPAMVLNVKVSQATRTHQKQLRASPRQMAMSVAGSSSSPPPAALTPPRTPPRAMSVGAMPTPDPHAFDGTATPHPTPSCPSPPHAPVRPALMRKNSLWDTKELFSFTHNETDDHSFADNFDLHPVGQGSFFHVFRATRLSDQRLFAIKKSKRLFRGKPDRQSYLREISSVALKEDHKNIVKYYRAWQENGHFWIKMEYCVCDLQAYIARLGGITRDLFWRCAYEVASGLAHVHAHNVLHLDVKPENVLVGQDGTLKLGDFGQSVLKDHFTDGNEGDSKYLAPEMLNTSSTFQPSTAADMFSLGLLLLEVLTNMYLPTQGPIWHQLRQGHALELVKREGMDHRVPMDADMQEMLASLLSPDPKQRMSAPRLVARYGHHYKAALSGSMHAAASIQMPMATPAVMKRSSSLEVLDVLSEEEDQDMETEEKTQKVLSFE